MKLTGDLLRIEITDRGNDSINIEPQISLDSLSEHEERDLINFVKDIITVCAKYPKLIDINNLIVNYQPKIKYCGMITSKEEDDVK